MAYFSMGVGLCGLLLNVLMFLNIYFDGKITLFYAIDGAIMVVGGALYLLERNNKFVKSNCTKEHTSFSISQIIKSCKSNSKPLYYLILIYIVTFSVFPGFYNEQLSFIGKKSKFFQIFFVTLFNLNDTIGRCTGGKYRSRYWKFLCWFRIIQAILIVTKCLKSDFAILLNLSVFSFLNGYL